MVLGLLRGGTIAPVSILAPAVPATKGSVCHKPDSPTSVGYLCRLAQAGPIPQEERVFLGA